MKLVLFGLGAFMLSLGLAAAQTKSAADIKAMVDQRVGGLSEYQQLLADPDPLRSLAAMQIMMESKDPMLERMALEYGIYSPSPAVRRTALDALLKSSPALRMTFDGSDTKGERFQVAITRAGGTVSSDRKGFLSRLVGNFDEERQCFLDKERNHCLIRNSDAGATVHLWNGWWSLALSEDGHLVGSGAIPGVDATVALSIPVTR